MTDFYDKLLRASLPLALCLSMSACGNDDPEPDPEPTPPAVETPARSTLLYAVNNSSLKWDFAEDCKEIEEALKLRPDANSEMLIYRQDDDTKCGLYSLEQDVDGNFVYVLLKEYPRDKTSTHPDRIAEVIDDALAVSPGAVHDLFFWGHGTSWTPAFDDHNVAKSCGPKRAYGGEYTGNGREVDWTDLIELADAIPDGRFETIWFDCCYMSSIEVIYELRNKCEWFVGYPTEVWQDGLSYDKVLPFMLGETVDRLAAAKAHFDFYNDSDDPVTVSVIDMSKLEPVADAVKSILASGSYRPSRGTLVNFGRQSEAYYDMVQFYGGICDFYGLNDLTSALKDAMSEMVPYHAESANNFNRKPWLRQDISGVSCHYFADDASPKSEYYKRLAWYARVYAQSGVKAAR